MRTKATLIILLLNFIVFASFSQSEEVSKRIDEGVALHDAGDFAGAISSYKKALEIDKNSTIAHYEIASTYYVLEQYDNAIPHVDRVIKINKEFVDQAYILKGTILDVSGKGKEAVKVY
jgi:tetratricopeptide (TPR) repeat protein